MTYPARAATGGEVTLFRTPGQWSKWRAAVFHPTAVYTARINQTFSTWDGVLEITYDTGVGTLADILPDMTLLIGSTPGAWDVGVCRIRSADVSKFYIGQESSVRFANDQYLTVVYDFGLYARHVLISGATPYMDGGIAYSDQHTNLDPVPIMGGDRVLKLTGSTVSTTFDWSHSYMPDGSGIASYATSAPGCSASSGMTTTTPTITWNSVGWKLVYLTLTGANGKIFFGVRLVFVWNASNEPPIAEIGDNGQDVDSGGWEMTITLRDNCNLDDIRDHALVIVFAEDHYGNTSQQIGPLSGCENIRFTGWIAKERISHYPENPSVTFTAYSAHYWLKQIPSYPDGVEFTANAATAWTNMQNLTVDLGLWHFLHWRTTATRVMDVFLTGNTFLTAEVNSLAQNLWDQIREFAFAQIFARAGVNEYNQLFIEIDPQLIPEADRGSIPVVVDLEKRDWIDGIEFDRVTMAEVAVVFGSGVAIDASGNSTAYFSVSPGNTYPHYGAPETIENLLVSSQSQLNTLTGLYRAARNNSLPDIPISLAANNPLIGCFPNQYCTITIDAADNPRGFGYAGKIIPTSKKYVLDASTGYCHTELSFEAETFADIAITDTAPGNDPSGDPPSVPAFPPLPLPPILTPIDTNPTGGTGTFLFWDSIKGFIYTTTMTSDNPTWIVWNTGLTVNQYKAVNWYFVCPNGVAYCGKASSNTSLVDGGFFLARASAIGGTWVIVHDYTSVHALYPETSVLGLSFPGYNRNVPESIGFHMGNVSNGDPNVAHFWIGGGGSFSKKVQISNALNANVRAYYGYGKWVVAGYRTGSFGGYPDHYWLLSADGSSIVDSHDVPATGDQTTFVHAGSTPIFYHGFGTGLKRWMNNLQDTPVTLSEDVAGGLGMAVDVTGTILLGRWGGKGYSVDQGDSWAALATLPPGTWYFVYGGNPGSSPVGSRWIAFSGASIRYSNDFVSWYNKEGNMGVINPTPHLEMGFAVSPYGG